MTTRTPYTPAWRRAVRSGVQSSAKVLVPFLAERLRPQSVIDIGCGEGWFVKEFEHLGIRATGCDGPWVDDVMHVDFSHPPYPELGPYDLALCLEVAEHIDEKHADSFVGWLCSLAPVVVFSAAIPGQGGEGHVNEQPPEYWARLFRDRSYLANGDLRWDIWEDNRISWWYRQNLLVFYGPSYARVCRFGECLHVVHPEAIAWHRK